MKKKLSIIFFLLTMLLLSVNIYAEMNVTVAQNADAKTLDPTASNDVPSHRVTLQIYDTLVERDHGKLVPGLAESWTQVDPLTLDVKIILNPKF